MKKLVVLNYHYFILSEHRTFLQIMVNYFVHNNSIYLHSNTLIKIPNFHKAINHIELNV